MEVPLGWVPIPGAVQRGRGMGKDYFDPHTLTGPPPHGGLSEGHGEGALWSYFPGKTGSGSRAQPQQAARFWNAAPENGGGRAESSARKPPPPRPAALGHGRRARRTSKGRGFPGLAVHQRAPSPASPGSSGCTRRCGSGVGGSGMPRTGPAAQPQPDPGKASKCSAQRRARPAAPAGLTGRSHRGTPKKKVSLSGAGDTARSSGSKALCGGPPNLRSRRRPLR